MLNRWKKNMCLVSAAVLAVGIMAGSWKIENTDHGQDAQNVQLTSASQAALTVQNAKAWTTVQPDEKNNVSVMETQETDKDILQSFATGPGLQNLSLKDNYATYQWGLKNDGEYQLTKLISNFRNVDQKTVMGKQADGVIALPGTIGPGAYSAKITDAVNGVDINIQPAWDLYKAAENKRQVTVAIIDTGIDISHPDLKDAIWTNAGEIPDDGIDNDGNGYIDDVHGWNFFSNNNQVFVGTEDEHGTHSAGTIGAAAENGGTVGITDNQYVKIMPVKALGSDNGLGTSQTVINAIKYAEANGASICNLSLGGVYQSEALGEAIKNSKMLFIVAAGNGNALGIGYDTDKYPVWPACFPYDNIISVANLLFDGTLDESSNYGAETVDIAAPGSFILSTTTDRTYGFMSGTSMSAPMVTGVAAMLYSYRPELTVLQVKDILLKSSRKMDTLTGKMVSGGLLDAYAALQYQQ